MLAARRIRSPVLAHFAVQLGGWGLVLGLIGAMEWQGLHLRDLAGATRLERATWARVGFDVGVIGMGAVLAVASRWFGRKPRGDGGGGRSRGAGRRPFVHRPPAGFRRLEMIADD